ncbi:hypothetical protein Hsero_2092 [Herbaspirillum seropedicae SmR1]|uniref:Uncharacterized protein n=1 Tax=Herbaspirillum seropedicae (strain SmR1) TaxID=757424 RepID=D8IT33_HERSS|nr:hypothetical protein Hsero_2092 [Herbaspirillum seropedicae SmR1]
MLSFGQNGRFPACPAGCVRGGFAALEPGLACAAAQLVHHQRPWQCVVMEAPGVKRFLGLADNGDPSGSSDNE